MKALRPLAEWSLTARWQLLQSSWSAAVEALSKAVSKSLKQPSLSKLLQKPSGLEKKIEVQPPVDLTVELKALCKLCGRSLQARPSLKALLKLGQKGVESLWRRFQKALQSFEKPKIEVPPTDKKSDKKSEMVRGTARLMMLDFTGWDWGVKQGLLDMDVRVRSLLCGEQCREVLRFLPRQRGPPPQLGGVAEPGRKSGPVPPRRGA